MYFVDGAQTIIIIIIFFFLDGFEGTVICLGGSLICTCNMSHFPMKCK